LLQRWFAASGHARAHDPYFLYVASNLGSLAALLGYPLLIEPLATLGQQSSGWGLGYAGLVALAAACAWLLLRDPARQPAAGGPGQALSAAPPTWPRRLRWVLLAFAPSSLLLGVTTYITTDLAAVPLFWVLPLALYLLSFVVVFARRPVLRHGWMLAAQPIALLAVLLSLYWKQAHAVLLTAPLHALLFFLCAMVCHGELAKDRPAARHLTEFYLWMSVGGTLGGLFNALAAPLLFDDVLEYPIAVALACMLRPVLAGRDWRSSVLDLVVPMGLVGILMAVPSLSITQRLQAPLAVGIVLSVAMAAVLAWSSLRPVRLGLLAVSMMIFTASASERREGRTVLEKRSFFGVHRVVLANNRQIKLLKHGTTTHGAQGTVRSWADQPLTYYHRDGPLGELFVALDGQLADGRIGVVGLGTGSVTCYGKSGQRLTFFEIDPTVVAIATNPEHFTFVASCGQVRPEVVLGDARLTLAREPDAGFALLLLDAFSSDAIPAHLMTREAVALYLRKLAPNGVVAFHISNRYLDLAPNLAAIVRDLGLVARISAPLTGKAAQAARVLSRYSATWVVLARDDEALGELRAAKSWLPLPDGPRVSAWTDDFSNILWALYAQATRRDP